MSAYHTLTLARDHGIATLTFNRPDLRNALDEDAQAELICALAAIATDRSIHAVVLTGAGRAFSAGGDINSMAGAKTDMAERARIAFETVRTAKAVVMALLTLPQPLIAALNGDAIGLGATLALAADIVVMDPSARIGDPHVKLGMVAGDGGAVLWPALIGPARAKELLLRGTLVTAETAKVNALISHVSDEGGALTLAQSLATELAALPPLAAQWTKQVMNKPILAQMELVFDAGIAFEALSFLSDDHREAVAAFSARRPARFSGR